MTRISDIAERLERATPGPWLLDRPEGEVSGFKVGMVIAAVAPKQCVWADPPGGIAPEANRALIAHAPSDLAYLLAENERLRAALTEATATLDEAANCLAPTFPSLAENV